LRSERISRILELLLKKFVEESVLILARLVAVTRKEPEHNIGVAVDCHTKEGAALLDTPGIQQN
jgi:hypothetical protein